MTFIGLIQELFDLHRTSLAILLVHPQSGVGPHHGSREWKGEGLPGILPPLHC